MNGLDEILAHYGVKGMKWGVRRKRGSDGKASAGTEKPKAKDLSDDELRKAVSRMQMERQYNDLVKGKSGKNAGAEFVKGIAMNVARATITGLATQQVNSALKKANVSK